MSNVTMSQKQLDDLLKAAASGKVTTVSEGVSGVSFNIPDLACGIIGDKGKKSLRIEIPIDGNAGMDIPNKAGNVNRWLAKSKSLIDVNGVEMTLDVNLFHRTKTITGGSKQESKDVRFRSSGFKKLS